MDTRVNTAGRLAGQVAQLYQGERFKLETGMAK